MRLSKARCSQVLPLLRASNILNGTVIISKTAGTDDVFRPFRIYVITILPPIRFLSYGSYNSV